MSKIFAELNREANAQQTALAEQRTNITTPHEGVTPKHHTKAPAGGTTSKQQIKVSNNTSLPKQESNTSHHETTLQTQSRTQPNKKTKKPTTAIDQQKLTTIVSELSELRVLPNRTPVRFSEAELKALDDFILIDLRNMGIQGSNVSKSKLVRYFTYYMIKVGGKEVVQAIEEALQREETLTI